MNKIEVNFKEPELKKLENWGINVKIYISDLDMRAILELYMTDLFGEGSAQERYTRAENGLIANILELQTNLLLIDENGGNPKVVVPLDTIFSSWKFYQDVENSIINIGELKRRILRSVEMRREEERLKTSLGVVLDNLYLKATEYINKIIETQLTEEQLESMRVALKELGDAPIIKILGKELQK